MEDPGHIVSASDASTSEGDKLASKGTVIASKTFREGAIYLFQRSDYKKPTWLCRVKVPGIKGYVHGSTHTGDEYKAFKFADDLYNQLLVKVLTGEAPVGKRIGPVIDAYIKRLEPQRTTRLSIHYKILLMERAKPFLSRKTFEELSTARISHLVDHLVSNTRKGSLSANSIKRILSDLKHFLNWCVEEGHLTALPKPPKTAGEPTRRPHFNAEEWGKLVTSMYPYLKSSPKYVVRDRQLLLLYVLVLGETGIRVGEARNLRWRDLRPISNSTDPDAPNLALIVKGKTGIREVVASGPKVREAMAEILRIRRKDLKDEASDIYEKDEVPTDSFIFCDKHGEAIKSFKKSFATFLKAINLTTDTFGQHRTLYSLRHTYATSRLEAGVNHYILAQNMGTSQRPRRILDMGQIARLGDLIDSLSEFDNADTIYAAAPWTEASEATVAREPDAGGLPEEVANAGLKYFLEVSIARDFVEDWLASLDIRPSSPAICQRVIDYAVNDA